MGTKRICKNGIKKVTANSTIRGDNTRQSCSTVHGAARTIKALVYQTHSARRNPTRDSSVSPTPPDLTFPEPPSSRRPNEAVLRSERQIIKRITYKQRICA